MGSKRMYEDLKEILCHELNEITLKGEINKESLDDVYKLLSALTMVESRTKKSQQGDEEEGEMSNRSGRSNYMPMWANAGGSNRGSYGSYEGGSNARGGGRSNESYRGRSNEYSEESYRRGRNPMTGRYMSMDSYDGSYENGYSRHSEEEKAIMKMEEIAETTQNPMIRQAIMQAVERLEQ